MRLKKFWKTLGPGLTTGAADDDPSGIATYSQLGAERGFGLSWLSVFSFPLLSVIEEMSGRIGIVTGTGLSTNIRRHYPRAVLYGCTTLLLFANIFNIGANLGAMAEASQLLYPGLNFGALVVAFALFTLILQVFVPYKIYAKYLKYLALVLLAYIFSALSVQVEWSKALYHAVVPSLEFSKEEIILVCAALGTTISPYLFFWQTSQEVEEEIMHGDKTEYSRVLHATSKDIFNMRLDVWTGMFVSNLVMFFIIAASAATLNASGIQSIETAADAALALRPFAGDFAFFLFAAGIIGTGLLSIPVLAGSASYAVAESFGWKEGLFQKLKKAGAFYGVIALSIILGILLNFTGIDPIKALIYSATLNGIISPVVLFLIVRISGRDDIMGPFKSSFFESAMGWFATIVMAAVSILALYFILA